MGRLSSAAYNPTLFNLAYGLLQDLKRATAGILAPDVVVTASAGKYKAFSDKNAFAVYETARALGGPAIRIAFAATDPSYDCKPQALEAAIDDAEYDAAGDRAAALEQSRVRALISNAVTSHEYKVWTAAKAGLSAVASRGNWSDASVSPIDQIDEQIAAIIDATGMMPNEIIMGTAAWLKAKNHPKVLARAGTTKVQGVSIADFTGMLLNPTIRLTMATLARDTAKLGADKSTTNIVGSECFIFISQPTPSEFDPSLMKTFRTASGGVDAVRTYRDDHARSTVHAVDWSEDIQVTGSECGRRLTIT